MSPEQFRALALLLPDTKEGAHMGHPDFRVAGKIFATLWVDEERAVVKLTPAEQELRIEAEPDVFEPIDGAWGRRGWTNIDLPEAEEDAVRSALAAAWANVAPPGLVAEYRSG